MAYELYYWAESGPASSSASRSRGGRDYVDVARWRTALMNAECGNGTLPSAAFLV
jgi:hypothetical protein